MIRSGTGKSLSILDSNGITWHTLSGYKMLHNLFGNPSFERSTATTNVRTNLATNPSFETTTGVANIRTNLFTNPSFEAASGTVITRTNHAINPGPSASVFTNWNVTGFGPGGAGTYTNTAGAGVDGGYAGVQTWTTAATGGGASIMYGNPGDMVVTPGNTYTVSIYAKTNQTITSGILRVNWTDAANAVISSPTTGAITYTAGVWTRMSLVGIVAPAGAARITVEARINDLAGMTNGLTFVADHVLVEQSSVLGPYFDGSTPLTNLSSNPVLATNASGWTTYGGSSTHASLTTSRAAASWASSGWMWKVQGSATSTAVMEEIGWGVLPNYLVVPGTVVTVGISVIASGTRNVRIRFRANGDVYSPEVTLNANNPTRLTGTFTVPAGASSVGISLHGGAASPGFGANDWIGASQAMVEYGTTSGAYYEGTGDFTYAWAAAANASSSVQRGVSVTGISGTAATIQSSEWKLSGTKSLRVVPISSSTNDSFANVGGDTGGMRLGMVAGKTYTVSATARLAAPLTGTLYGLSLRIRLFYRVGTGAYVASDSALLDNVAGSNRLSTTAALPAGTTEAFIRLYHGGLAGSGDMWWDDLLVEESPIVLPYFDGTNPPANKNLSLNPSAETNLTGWVKAGGTSGTLTRDTTRALFGAASVKFAYTSGTATGVQHEPVSVSPNTTYTVSFYVYLESGTFPSFTICDPYYAYQIAMTPTTGVVGSWTRVYQTFTTAAGQTSIMFYNTMGVPSTYFVDGVLIEQSATLNSYFNHSWTGTANASTSVQTALAIAGLSAGKNVGLFYGYQEAVGSEKFARWVAPAGSGSSTWRIAMLNTATWDFNSVKSGKTYTLLFRYRANGWGTSDQFIPAITDGSGTNAVIGNDTGRSMTAPNWTEYRRTFTALRDATAASTIYISLPNTPQASTDGVFDMAEWLLVEGAYTGPYFDGSTVGNLSTVGTVTPLTDTSLTSGVSYAGSVWTRATVAAGPAAARLIRNYIPLTNLTNGATYTTSVTLANDQAVAQTLQLDWCDASGVSFTLAPGEIRRVSTTGSRATYDTVIRFSDLEITRPANESRSVLFKDWSVELSPASGQVDYTYAWTGTASTSTSVQVAAAVNSVNQGNAAAVQSAVWALAGTESLRIVPNTGNPDSYVQLNGVFLQTGKQYTIKATIRLEAPQTGALDQRARKIVVYHSSSVSANDASPAAPNVAGTTQLSLTFTVTDQTQYQSIRLYNGASASNGDVWWDNFIIVEGDGTDVEYFDGDTPADDYYIYVWDGTPHASVSTAKP